MREMVAVDRDVEAGSAEASSHGFRWRGSVCPKSECTASWEKMTSRADHVGSVVFGHRISGVPKSAVASL